MKPPEMPELPRSHFHDPRYGMSHEPGFTADQMRSFFELGYKMGREDAAKLCDAQIDVYETKKEQAHDAGMWERWERMEHYRDAVDNIAAAIRRQGEQG